MGSEEERKEEDTPIGYRKHDYDALNPPKDRRPQSSYTQPCNRYTKPWHCENTKNAVSPKPFDVETRDSGYGRFRPRRICLHPP